MRCAECGYPTPDTRPIRCPECGSGCEPVAETAGRPVMLTHIWAVGALWLLAGYAFFFGCAPWFFTAVYGMPPQGEMPAYPSYVRDVVLPMWRVGWMTRCFLWIWPLVLLVGIAIGTTVRRRRAWMHVLGAIALCGLGLARLIATNTPAMGGVLVWWCD